MNEILQESCQAYLDLYSVMYEYTTTNSIITSNMDNPNIETIIEGVVSKWTSIMKEKLGKFKEKILELIKKFKVKVTNVFSEIQNRSKSNNNSENTKPDDKTDKPDNIKPENKVDKEVKKGKPKKIKDYRLKDGVQYCNDTREHIIEIIKKIEMYTENEEYIENDEEKQTFVRFGNRITEKYMPRLNKYNEALSQANISKAFNLSTDKYVDLESHDSYEAFREHIKEEHNRLIKMLDNVYKQLESKLNNTMKYLDSSSKSGNIKTKEFNSALSTVLPLLNQSTTTLLNSVNVELQAVKTISNTYLFGK